MTSNLDDIHDRVSIDSILQNLSNRPNVQYTLILSRKDGSIIKATGVSGRQGSGSLEQMHNAVIRAEGSSTALPSNGFENTEERTTTPQPPGTSQLALLAGSVYKFVEVAGHLSSSMALEETPAGSVLQKDVHKSGDTHNGQDTGIIDHEHFDQGVQLLRLRTKRQEIIIFPDPKYLCCVVQNIGGNEQSRGR